MRLITGQIGGWILVVLERRDTPSGFLDRLVFTDSARIVHIFRYGEKTLCLIFQICMHIWLLGFRMHLFSERTHSLQKLPFHAAASLKKVCSVKIKAKCAY